MSMYPLRLCAGMLCAVLLATILSGCSLRKENTEEQIGAVAEERSGPFLVDIEDSLAVVVDDSNLFSDSSIPSEITQDNLESIEDEELRESLRQLFEEERLEKNAKNQLEAQKVQIEENEEDKKNLPSEDQTDKVTLKSYDDVEVYEGVRITGEKGKEPRFDIASDAKDPNGLVRFDIIHGEGKEVAEGDSIKVHYSGVRLEDNQVFDSSYVRGQAASFGLEQVILGWRYGLVGTKVGGVTALVIPAEYGYGVDPPPGTPSGTLVFLVEILDVL